MERLGLNFDLKRSVRVVGDKLTRLIGYNPALIRELTTRDPRRDELAQALLSPRPGPGFISERERTIYRELYDVGLSDQNSQRGHLRLLSS